MNKRLLYGLLGGVLLVVFLFLVNIFEKERVVISDYKDISYTINGKKVELTDDGIKYFGNEVRKDLDGDGREDIAFLITEQSGGSATFFYVVAALNTEGGYVGSHGLLLGDRIAPQTTESGVGKQIVVNYADRMFDEPMTNTPSVGKSLWLLLDPETMQFGEVVQNFEGEADPDRMTLGMKTWIWKKAFYNDGREITPKQADKFTITFNKDGTFSASTDCNGVGGNYTAKDGKITFTNMMSTLMYCDGSEEAVYTKLLSDSGSYFFTSKGELVLGLKFDSGSVIFK